jgi:hypothetical protein
MGWKIETRIFSNFLPFQNSPNLGVGSSHGRKDKGGRALGMEKSTRFNAQRWPPPSSRACKAPLATFLAPSFLRLLLQVNSMTIFFGTFSSLSPRLTCRCVGVKLGGLAWFFDLTTVSTCLNVIYFSPCIGTKVNPLWKKHIVSLSNKLSFGGYP